jgi:hypothetical protein
MGYVQLSKEGSEFWPGGTENCRGTGDAGRICGSTANALSIIRYPGRHQSWTRAGGASRTLLCFQPPTRCSARHSDPPYLLVNRAPSMRRRAARTARGSGRQQTGIIEAAKSAEADGQCRQLFYILCRHWAYSTLVDAGHAQRTSYPDMRVRRCAPSGRIADLHMPALPFLERKTANTQFELCLRVLDVFNPQ